MMSWVVWLSTVGWASGLEGVDIPELDAQLYRMPVDSDGLLWTDTSKGVGDGFLFRTGMNFAQGSMAYLPPQGDPVMVLSGATALDVVAGYGAGPVRLAAILPVLYTAGLEEVSGAGLGNVGVDGRLTLVDGPLGLALGGRVGLPTLTLNAPMGGAGLSGDVLAIVDAEFGEWKVATNLGARLQSGTQALDQTWDDQLLVRLGASYGVSDVVAMSADVGGHANLSSLGDSPGAFPLEALVGSHIQPGERVAFRFGLGRGLTSGLGASQFRAVAMIDLLSAAGERERKVRTPREKPQKAERPQEADVFGSGGTRLELIGSQGQPVAGAIVSGGVSRDLGDGAWSFSPGQGALGLTIRAPGYVAKTMELQDLPGVTRVVQLSESESLRVVEVHVFGAEGRPLTGAIATIGGHTLQMPGDQAVRMALPLGEQRVLVEAAGYGPTYQDVQVGERMSNVIRITLGSNPVVVRPGALDLPKPLRANDTVLQRSVIAEMLVRPGIRQIRLVGDPETTAAVRQSMLAQGCDGDRLIEDTVFAGPPAKGTFDVVVGR